MNRTDTTDTRTSAPRGATRRWAKRLGLGLGATAAVLAVAGATFQSVSAAADRRDFPAPGKMVPVGDHALHLYCTGAAEGEPTIVLEAGFSGTSSTWAWIQPELSRTHRVCSYDRPGLGWSEGGDSPRDAQHTIQALHTALDRAGESGPYLLVGHSMGGLFIREFARRYIDEVSGMFFLDASHPEQLERFGPDMRKTQERYTAMMRLLPPLAHLGVTRLVGFPARQVAGLPESDYGAVKAFGALPQHLEGANAEMALWDSTSVQASRLTSVGERPVLVVSASEMPGSPAESLDIWHGLHRELASLSTRGRHVVLEGTDHLSLIADREDALEVAGLIRGLAREVDGSAVR